VGSDIAIMDRSVGTSLPIAQDILPITDIGKA
jgi:hypothetical protein